MVEFIFLIDRIFRLYEFVIIARCVISWVQAYPYNPIVRFIAYLTDPLMDAIRRAFPFLVAGGFDFSPILALLLVHVTRDFVVSTAYRLVSPGAFY